MSWYGATRGRTATKWRPNPVFPLMPSANGHYFRSPDGTPFFFFLDAAWTAPQQLTNAQQEQYLDDRLARGFSATVVYMITGNFTSQTPLWLNAAGVSPFSTISAAGDGTPATCDFSSYNPPYYDAVENYVKLSLARGMEVVLSICYAGFPGASPAEGWYAAFTSDTNAHLQAYGAYIGGRFGKYPNILWQLGGDNSLNATDLTKQWNIVTGLLGALPSPPLIYVKAQRNTSSYSLITADGGFGSYPGANVNNAYVSNQPSSYTQVTDCLAEYGRSPATPVFMDEQTYEGSGSSTPKDIRYAWYCGLCCGIYGGSFGNYAIEVFGGVSAGSPVSGAAAALAGYLSTTGSQQAAIFAAFAKARITYDLVPQDYGVTLVTTSLGTDSAPVRPATSPDGTRALVYTGAGTGFTVDRTQMTLGSIHADWFDPTAGTLQADAASPMPNTGTHSFTTPGNNSAGDTDWTLVLH